MTELTNEERQALYGIARGGGQTIKTLKSLEQQCEKHIPEKIIVDNSTLQTFKDCPFKCYLRYRRHLVLKDDSNIFKPEFGSAIHEAMASWYKEKSAEKMDNAFIKYWQNFDGQDFKGLRTMERGLVILEIYRKQFIDEPITADPELIEIGGSVDIGSFIFCFRLDGVVKWLDWDGYYILEHKTSARRNSICVKPNAQVEGYVFGAVALTGLKIQGALFNFFFFRKGRKGERTEATIEITRQMVDITEETIEMWKKDFLYWASSFREAVSSGQWPRNAGMCFAYGKCPYLAICEVGGKVKDVSVLYEEKEWRPFPEAKEDK